MRCVVSPRRQVGVSPHRRCAVPRDRCASQGGGSEPYSIQWNAFTELMQQCRVPDHNTCELKDLDTIFIATNVQVGLGLCVCVIAVQWSHFA